MLRNSAVRGTTVTARAVTDDFLSVESGRWSAAGRTLVLAHGVDDLGAAEGSLAHAPSPGAPLVLPARPVFSKTSARALLKRATNVASSSSEQLNLCFSCVCWCCPVNGVVLKEHEMYLFG